MIYPPGQSPGGLFPRPPLGFRDPAESWGRGVGSGKGVRFHAIAWERHPMSPASNFGGRCCIRSFGISATVPVDAGAFFNSPCFREKVD